MTVNAVSYSRQNPSMRYRELQNMYRQLHDCGEPSLKLAPEQTFSGTSLLPQLARIKELVQRTGASTILDYGCGKGMQYEQRTLQAPDGSSYDGVVDYWDVAAVHCYDPCYEPFMRLPVGTYHGVISTDVLEHCPEEDVPWIVEEIFGYAERFVFANVACYPAMKHLPNGENAHCTIKPVAWWSALFLAAASARPVVWQAVIQSRVETPQGPRLEEQVIGEG
jgi:hypothetical protein